MKYKAGGHYEGELSQGLREGLVPRGLGVCVCSGGRTTKLVCLTLEAGIGTPFSARIADEPIRTYIQRASGLPCPGTSVMPTSAIYTVHHLQGKTAHNSLMISMDPTG